MSILENPLLQAEVREAALDTGMPFMEKRRTLRVQSIPTGPSMTKTDMAEQCDINVILKNYKTAGVLPQRTDGQWADMPSDIDFHAAQNLIAKSREEFDALPAKVRDRFLNDPGRLLGFMQDPQNRQEAEQLGLIKRPTPDPEPAAAPPAPPPQNPPA